jgi:hypothetical protein
VNQKWRRESDGADLRHGALSEVTAAKELAVIHVAVNIVRS